MPNRYCDEVLYPANHYFGSWHLQQFGLWELLWLKRAGRAHSLTQNNSKENHQCDVQFYRGFEMVSSEFLLTVTLLQNRKITFFVG